MNALLVSQLLAALMPSVVAIQTLGNRKAVASKFERNRRSISDWCPFASVEDSNFNVLVCGDFYMPNGTADTEGSLGVLGEFAVGRGYSVGEKEPCNEDRYGLVVGGDLDWKSGALLCDKASGVPGNNFVKWAVGGNNVGSVPAGHCCDKQSPLPIDLNGICDDLMTRCEDMSNIGMHESFFGAQNVHVGSVSLEWGTMTIAIDDAYMVNVVTVESSKFKDGATPHTISIKSVSGALTELTTKVIVNIIPDTTETEPVFFQGMHYFDGNLLTSAIASHIVWVKCDTSDLIIRWQDFKGSWLAPRSPLSKETSGQFNGRAVVGSYIGEIATAQYTTIQFNRNSFFECPSPKDFPATPAPTQATFSPTPTPTKPAGGFGDPHMINIRGERFDIWQLGEVELLRMPRGAAGSTADLRFVANVSYPGKNVGHGCTNPAYMTYMRFSGNLFGTQALLIKMLDGKMLVSLGDQSLTPFIGHATTEKGVIVTRPSEAWVTVQIGNATIDVMRDPLLKRHFFLNTEAHNLGSLGYEIGGVLGLDDHTLVAQIPAHCKSELMALASRTNELLAAVGGSKASAANM